MVYYIILSYLFYYLILILKKNIKKNNLFKNAKYCVPDETVAAIEFSYFECVYIKFQ